MSAELTIVSGGQTGVDRAALDVALDLGLPCRGWCPADRGAEDGPIPDRYPLEPTPSSNPAQRTEWNVRDSDATLIVAVTPLTGGTDLAQRFTVKHGRTYLILDPDHDTSLTHVRDWIERSRIRVLNVAGPPESEFPGIYELACTLLRRLFEELAPPDDDDDLL